MWKCEKCLNSEENIPNFCKKCGKKVGMDCAQCNTINLIGSQFCTHCGSRLRESDEAAIPSQPLLNISYVCVDIKESTKLISNIDVEAAREWIESSINIMTHSVKSYNGTIYDLTGDGIIAFFTGEEHSLRACLAGADIQQNLLLAKIPSHARVGVHTDYLHENTSETTTLKEQHIKITQAVESIAPVSGIEISCKVFKTLCDVIEVGAERKINILGGKLSITCYTLQNISSKLNLLKSKEKTDSEPLKIDIPDINQKAVIGEKKFVTNVFFKLSNSNTEADMLPSQCHMDMLSNAITYFEGTAIKRWGDSIYAIFGAPIAYEDHCLRACLAANYLQEKIINEGLLLDFRVGINSGEVVIDKIGDENFHRYDAVGASINLAARMMQTADRDQIQLSDYSYKLIKDYIRCIPLGEKYIKGFDKSIPVWSLTSLNTDAIQKKMDVMFYQGSVFVGREKEKSFILSLYKKVEKRKGQLLGIGAEAGIGKSRLLFEVTQELLNQGIKEYAVSSSSYEKKIAFSTLKRLFKNILGVNGTTVSALQERVIRAELKNIDFTEPFATEALLTIVGRTITKPQWVGMAAVVQQRVLFTTLIEYLQWKTRSKAMVIILEDLHWCDEETLGFLKKLCLYLKKMPLFIILDYRLEFTFDEYFPKMGKELLLSPLKKKTSKKLLNILLPGKNTIISLRKKILTISEGSPFFMEEYVKMLIARKEIIKDETGNYIPGKELNIEEMPLTVLNVVGARIDQLEVEEKLLLQQASLLGRVFPLELLTYMNELKVTELSSVLSELVGKGFIQETALLPKPEYTFLHANILDVAYNTVLTKNKCRYHGRLVEQIELKKQRQLEKYYRILAYHSQKANLWDKALRYYNLLLPKDISVDFPTMDYLDLCPRGRHCFSQLEEDQQKILFDDYARITLLYIHTLFISNEFEKEKQIKNELEEKAEYFGNILIQLYIRGWKIIQPSQTGNCQSVLDNTKEVLQLIHKLKNSSGKIDSDILIDISFFCMHGLWPLADYKKCDELLEPILNSSLPLTYTSHYVGVPIIAITFMHYFVYQCIRGNYQAMEKHLPYLLDAEAKGLVPSEGSVAVFISLTLYYYFIGDVTRFIHYGVKGFNMANEIQHHIFYAMLSPFYAYHYFHDKKPEKALKYALESKMLFEKSDYIFLNFTAHITAEIFARTGKIDNALALTETLLSIVEKDNQKPYIALCSRLKALCLNLKEKTSKENEEILNYLEKAENYAEEMGCYSEIPFIKMIYHEYYDRIGDKVKSKKYYQEALDCFQQYHMTGWYEKYKGKKVF